MNIECTHIWKLGYGDDKTKCSFSQWYPAIDRRSSSTNCQLQACYKCVHKKSTIPIPKTISQDKRINPY